MPHSKLVDVNERLKINYGKRLGHGKSSVVYEGFYQGTLRAVKEMMFFGNKKAAQREQTILSKLEELGHKNIVRFYGLEIDECSLYLVLGLCHGTLKDYVTNEDLIKGFCPSNVIKSMTEGLHYLHSEGIVHRDLKPENVLYALHHDAKTIRRVVLGDFGTSKSTIGDMFSVSEAVGTQGYIPNEMCNAMTNLAEQDSFKELLNAKSDIFALGILFCFTLSKGKHPFDPPFARQGNILKKRKPDLPPPCDGVHNLKDLILNMLDHNPENRPSMEVVLAVVMEMDTIDGDRVVPLVAKSQTMPLLQATGAFVESNVQRRSVDVRTANHRKSSSCSSSIDTISLDASVWSIPSFKLPRHYIDRKTNQVESRIENDGDRSCFSDTERVKEIIRRDHSSILQRKRSISLPGTDGNMFNKMNQADQARAVGNLVTDAAEGNYLGVMRHFVCGVPMDMSDYDDRTALHVAVANGREEIVRYLLDHCKVDPNVKDTWGHTPYDEARRVKNGSIKKLLEKHFSEEHLEIIRQESSGEIRDVYPEKFQFLANKMKSTEFKSFYRRLVDHEDVDVWIDEIERDYRNESSEQKYQLMVKWKKVFPHKTDADIARALQDCDLNEIRKSYEIKFEHDCH